MNLPNKLTVLRMIMVPFFVVFLLWSDTVVWFKWIAFALFIIASFTDFLDGYIARKNNLVTSFGKFMDPLADKLLVCSALIVLTGIGMVPSWATSIIIGREFIISGFRLVAAEKGSVIAAGMWGKVKTVVQMVMTCLLLVIVNVQEVTGFYFVLKILADIAMWLSVILTVISLIDYLWKNKGIMKEVEDA